MANGTQAATKAVGIVLVVAGIGLAYWGYQISGSVGSQLRQAFSGSHSDEVMIRYIAGAASFAVGLFLFFKK
ncbi:MAG: hypothetical protein A3H31_13195 [Gallionellales bacterium RIFCSPLOWO2_02_FULL_57_47]|nr:MAG: hypothetical protein A3H31_13195 [Gallionellales bacterium RIFCSPLOWO2_02_FULL_57_47]OGT14035.1 MAG: hypothetical protein A3J49_05910 [Gallionellales bacterium RIFCSPHIGHO2_02_FULL_57_16]